MQFIGQTFALSRARFDLEGVPLGIVTNFSCTRTHGYQPVMVAGQLIAGDHAPLNVTVQGSFTVALILGQDPVAKKLVPSMAGTVEQQVQEAINFLGKVIRVWDIKSEKYVMEIQGYVPGGLGVGLTPVGSGNVPFAAVNCLFESELNAG
jgi:hypothetical protein